MDENPQLPNPLVFELTATYATVVSGIRTLEQPADVDFASMAARQKKGTDPPPRQHT